MGTINKQVISFNIQNCIELKCLQMIMKSMQLNFNLSCWQNRRARIYLDGEDICDSKYLKIDMPILLVTDTKERSERLIFGGREICIFYEGVFSDRFLYIFITFYKQVHRKIFSNYKYGKQMV